MLDFAPTQNLRYHPRVESDLDSRPRRPPSLTGLKRGHAGDAQQEVALDATLSASERTLIQRITNGDDSLKRRVMLNAINDLSQRIGDIVARNRTVRLVGSDGADLSSEGSGVDPKTIGIPQAVQIGTDDRLRADTRWAALFAVQDLRASPSPYFEITDVYNALTFREYELGEKIDMGFVKATETVYKAALYAAGLQWNMLWEGWQNDWSAGDGIAAMQAKYLSFQAKTAYSILTASGGISVSWQGETNDTQAARDAKTINEGVRVIKEALFSEAGPDGEDLEEDLEGANFFCLYDSLEAGTTERVDNALEARYQSGDGELTEVKYNVTPLGSPHINGGPYIILPQRKNVLGLSRDLTLYDTMDPRIAGVAEGSVGQAAWRMVRGDSNQTSELTFG